MRPLILFALFSILFTPVQGQDPHSSNIGIAPSIYNPALTGIINGARTRIEVNSRYQWGTVVGRQDEFRTYMASAESYLCLASSGRCSACPGDVLAIGFYAMSDRRGESPLYRFDGNLAIAYRKFLSKNKLGSTYLSIGGKAGVIGHSINFGDLSFDEQFDNPGLPPEISGRVSSFVPDYSIGVAYSQLSNTRIGTSYEVGFSMLHLNTPDFSLLEEVVDERLGQTINMLLVGHFRASLPIYQKAISFNPSIIYRWQKPHQQLLIESNFLWALNESNFMTLGAGYRVSSGPSQWRGDAFIASFGLLLNQQLELSFHFDTGTFVQRSVPQSLEARIGYRFGNPACVKVFCP